MAIKIICTECYKEPIFLPSTEVVDTIAREHLEIDRCPGPVIVSVNQNSEGRSLEHTFYYPVVSS